MGCKIEKLPSPEASGDWHDAPLKWAVVGPGAEVQKFSSRAWAREYARGRNRAPDAAAAERAFMGSK